jgi:hypothetical protein
MQFLWQYLAKVRDDKKISGAASDKLYSILDFTLPAYISSRRYEPLAAK